MRRRQGRVGVVLLVVVTGCVTAAVVNPDVVGPHGEHLIELRCVSSERCLAFARETCGGDYDIVTNNDEVLASGAKGTASADVMMVQCKSVPPAAPPAAALDAGP